MPRKGVKTYTKKDLIEIVSKKTNIPIEESTKMVEGVLKVIVNILAEADPEVRIEIRGFGTLEIVIAAAKPAARNPRTNEVIYVPSHRKVRFKAGKLLSNILKQSL